MKNWIKNLILAGGLIAGSSCGTLNQITSSKTQTQEDSSSYLMKKLNITNKNNLCSLGNGYYTSRTGKDILRECVGMYNGTIEIYGNANKYFLTGKMGNLEDNPELTKVLLEVGDNIEKDKIITWQEALNLKNAFVERKLREKKEK